MCFSVLLSFPPYSFFFFLNDPAPTEFSPLPLHDALPIKFPRPARLQGIRGASRAPRSELMRARGAAGRVGDVGRGSRSRPTRTAGEDLLLDEAPAPTFEEAARSWVAAYAQLGQLRVSTQALYLSALEHYAFPRFGSKPVTTVSRDDIRGLVV